MTDQQIAQLRVGDRVCLGLDGGIWTVAFEPQRPPEWGSASVLVRRGGSYQRIDAWTPGGVHVVTDGRHALA